MTTAPFVSHGTSLDDLKGRLGELRAKVDAQAEAAWDDVVEMKRARFEVEGQTPFIRFGSDAYPLVGNALGSLCAQLEIPAKFYEACADKGLHGHGVLTLQEFLGAKLRTRPDYKLLARFRKDETLGTSVVRAFCSEGYGRFDNREALSMLFDVLPKGVGDPVALTTYCDVDDLKGTLLFPGTQVNVPGDSAYYLGLYYRNSEVGRSAFGVAPFMFRSFCTNTAIYDKRGMGGDVSLRHYGNIDLKQLAATLAATVERQVEGAPNLLKLMGYARDTPVSDPEGMAAYLAYSNNLPHTHSQAWREAMKQEPGNNAGAVLDGLTRAAQKYDAGWRIHMESTAGELLAPKLEATPKQVQARWEEYGRGARAFANTKPEKYRRYMGLTKEADNN